MGWQEDGSICIDQLNMLMENWCIREKQLNLEKGSGYSGAFFLRIYFKVVHMNYFKIYTI